MILALILSERAALRPRVSYFHLEYKEGFYRMARFMNIKRIIGDVSSQVTIGKHTF